MQSNLVQRFKDELRLCKSLYPNTRRWVIGLSGGLDSTALLYLASQVLPKQSILAVYVDHQLQHASGEWARHCADLCAELGVEIKVLVVTPRSRSESDARDARYQAFESILEPGDLLLMAHHADDQAETFLFRLFRGSGLRGLTGIPKSRPFGRAYIYRPLLDVSRAQLKHYLESLEIRWVEDPSNLNDEYARNWIRNRLAVVLSERYKNWRSVLEDTRSRLDDAQSLNRDLAEIDLTHAELSSIISIRTLRCKPLRRIKNAIYYWLIDHQIIVGSEAQLSDIALLLSEGKKSGEWQFDDVLVSLFDDHLYLRCAKPEELIQKRVGIVDQPEHLGSGDLNWVPAERGFDFRAQFRVRRRREGDRVQVPLRGGSVSIKKLMNEQRIPPWQRDNWPILEVEGQIVSVPGLWIDEDILIEGGFRPNWQHGCLSQT